MTGESVRPFGSKQTEAERAALFPPKQVRECGDANSRVSTICKSWSYKPLAFQRFRLRGRRGQAAKRLGMIVKTARCSPPLKGRSGATVAWQGRPSDRPKRDRPALAGR